MRNRRSFGWMLLALVLAMPLPALAQANGTSVRLAGGLGLAFPTGDELDGLNTGWVIATGLVVRPAGWRVAMRGTLGYARMGTDEATIDEESFGGSFKPFVLDFGLMVPLTTTGSVHPYLAAGLGYGSAKVGVDAGNVTVSASESGVAYHGAFGLRFLTAGGRTSFFAEARYQAISLDDATVKYIPIFGGVSITLK